MMQLSHRLCPQKHCEKFQLRARLFSNDTHWLHATKRILEAFNKNRPMHIQTTDPAAQEIIVQWLINGATINNEGWVKKEYEAYQKRILIKNLN